MAIIRNTASALRRGKVGNETYYVALNKQVVRVAQNDSNYGETASRTIGQQGNRVRWANLVSFYKLSKSWMAKAFENKKSGQSDYNRFMQLNLANAKIFFTKEAVAASAVVVDEFTISQGSLRQVNIVQAGQTWRTDIYLGDLTIDASTTIGALTSAVLDANNWAREGMQISFISYQQQRDSLGYPTAICTAYELTLAKGDTRLVRDFLPEFCSQRSAIGTLGTSDNISIGGFAYILSQTIGGKTLVSTQQLVVNNSGIVNEYSSARMRELAIYSYGLDEESFLDSGSNPTRSSAQPLFITSLNIEGNVNTFLPGLSGPVVSAASLKEFTLHMSGVLPAGVTVQYVEFLTERGGNYNMSGAAISENRKDVTCTMPTISGDYRIEKITIHLNAGDYEIVFDNSPVIHE